jgi:phosphatidylserine/phosphatidylglycerophosphate/cardiolipin synthase-like enzyme
MPTRPKLPANISILVFAIVALGVFLQSAVVPFYERHRTYQPNSFQVFFSPKGGCTDAAVTALDSAKSSVLVQAYSFTSPQIAKALVDAHKRGVKVEVILDKSQRQEQYSEADFIARANIPTWIDAKHAIAHNKIMIIDGETVLTGSFNFTRQAESQNAENLLVIYNAKDFAQRYTDNWEAHRAHSEQYSAR